MAGTLFSLALSQQMDSQGKPLLNAPLYVYEANTSTPADTYEDYGLEIVNPWPLRTDGAGRLPPFWLDDGAYRARFTDEAGSVVYFDIPFVQALGPSSGEGGGGGGSVDADAIFQTGDTKWRANSGTLAGWVRLNGRTIGSATSGATERANADTQALYEHLWNNHSNDICPVTGGRGVSAAADFGANKALALYSMRGRGAVGVDDMGNSAEGVLVDGTPTVEGSTGGTEKPTLARNQLPNFTLSGTTGTAGSHQHTVPMDGVSSGLGTGGSSVVRPQGTTNTSSAGSHEHSFTTPSINGGVTQQPLNVMGPYRLGTFYIKL